MAVTHRRGLALRLRLALLVAAIVAAVIGIEGYLEIRFFEQRVRDDFLEAAGSTAQAVADELELRGDPKQATEIRPLLRDFVVATPSVHDIAVVMKQGDALTLFVRTSSATEEDILPAARQAIERAERIWIGQGRERIVAAPVMRRRQVVGAVTVSVSLASIEQLGRQGREVTLLFAIPAIVVLTVLVDVLAQRFVHRPLTAIRRTMQRAGAGELGVRAPIDRPDEMGAVASGLNEMLVRIEQFQAELQARVEEATGELRRTNAELVDSHHRVLTLREALAQAEQLAALGQMAANAAHQIGTPLNLISGYVQMMIEEARSDTRSLHRLQTIEAQIGRVTEAVKTMLDYSRRPGLQREAVDVRALVEQVCEVSRPALRAAKVEVHIETQGSVRSIFADPVQLELALLNLVSNSMDAMPAGGRLEIVLSAIPEGVRLVVADTGTGIPADVLPRIFEPWVTTKAPGHGTGLGLSITRDVITSHGGVIGVRSEPGQGAVFTIDLPAASAPAAPNQLCRES